MKKILLLVIALLTTIFNCVSYSQMTPTLNDIMIPMSDLEELEADVYIPAGCVSCEVILVQTPYNKDLFQWSLPLGIGMNVDAQPFIWVIVDWRGFYGSSGADLTSVDRGQDGYDICEWITSQPWHGSRIGTWGPSALGNIQYQLIEKQHPNHTCAVPIVSHAQQSYAAYYTGGVLEEARLNQLDALGYGLSPIVLANPYYSPIWTFAESTSWYADDIIIPTLQIGGWYDHNIDEMMKFYTACRTQAAVAVQDEQWLLVGPWVHGGTGIANVGSVIQGELLYANAAHKNDSMAWDFFEYYLLDSVNNWQSTPKITYYEMGGNNVWQTSNAANIEITTDDVLFLNSSNKLTSEIGNGSSTFISDPNNPSPTIGGATLSPGLYQGPYDQSSLDGRSDIYTFSTANLTEDVSITGRITLDLYISSNQPDCDISVRLVDVYPDGTDMLITDGIKRMRFRDGYTASDEEFMTAGTVYNVQVDLPFTNYTWLAGHQIKVYIGGNHSTRFNVNLQNGGAMYTAGTANIANIIIHHDAVNQSKLILPGNNPSLGIETGNLTTQFELYPNPVSDALTIKSTTTIDAFSIIDMSGRIVMRGQPTNGIISVSSLKSGIYILSLMDENGTKLEQKFVKN